MAGLRSLDQEGITPTAFTLREPSLDDVFLALTGRRAEDETEETGDPEKKRRRWARAPRRQRSHAHRHWRVLMTTAIAAPSVSGAPHADSVAARLRWAVSDTLTITKRNLLALLRIPEQLFFSTVQPIMFVLLFTYVFGGAIKVPGGPTTSTT